MPRTKAVEKRAVHDSINFNDETTVSVGAAKKKDLNQKIAEFEDSIQATKQAVKIQHNSTLVKIQEFYTNLRVRLQDAGIGNLTLRELRNADDKTANCVVENVPSSQSKKKATSYRSRHERSNSYSSRPVSKKTDRLRSVSCDRVKRNIHHSESKFKTPVNSNIPPIPTVTPKVNPSQPVSVLRRPRLGEYAVSLHGSPLMVSGVSHDDMVSVSIPLSDGRILSILPTEGIDAADLHLDDETRNQLKKLRQNLNKCLAK